jgi:hypothetical protein
MSGIFYIIIVPVLVTMFGIFLNNLSKGRYHGGGGHSTYYGGDGGGGGD